MTRFFNRACFAIALHEHMANASAGLRALGQEWEAW